MRERIVNLLYGRYGRAWCGREFVLTVEEKGPGIYDITGTVGVTPDDVAPLAIAFDCFNYVADAILTEFEAEINSVGLSNGDGVAAFVCRCYIKEVDTK